MVVRWRAEGREGNELVGADTGCFEGFGGELFVLVWAMLVELGGFVICDVLETRWMHIGNSSTPARFLYNFLVFRSYAAVLSGGLPAKVEDSDLWTVLLSDMKGRNDVVAGKTHSGTPRLKRDFGYGLFLQ